jgi:ribA/ribD-fused uncharacterized protein
VTVETGVSRSREGLIAWFSALPPERQANVRFEPFFRASSPLSQWHPQPFTANGIRYANAEQYMMAAKARLFSDSENEMRIMSASTPGQMKALGRRIPPFEESVWLANREAIVLAGSLAKFTSSQEMCSRLTDTGVSILVEASPYDKIWGAGIAAADQRLGVPSSWPGLNLLGFVLMSVRDKLKV